MSEYYLMHKDDRCAILQIDEAWDVSQVKIIDQNLTPFIGTADKGQIKNWWKQRAIPASRKMLEELMRSAGYKSNTEYLAKNLALSVTDCYWICPVGEGLSWSDINMRNMGLINNGKIPYHNNTSYDPNAALSGQMEKYWDLTSESPQLVKEAYKHYGQQAVNEYFATQIHKMQKTTVPFTEYRIRQLENGIECRCDCFVKEGLEFIPAYEVINSEKIKNDVSLYDAYINICEKHGIEAEEMRKFMDYQTLSDFVITNEDEHWNNFGILRDINTLKFVKPAPIFDSGNSMFFRDERVASLERHELLNRTITAMHDKEEQMLKHVVHKELVNNELLPSEQSVIELYTKTGIPEEKSIAIADNYKKKIELLRDFQHGKNISFYNEKRAFEKLHHKFLPTNESQSKSTPKAFIMTCGLPKTGKSEKVKIEVEKLDRIGMIQVNAAHLYSVEQAISDTTPFFDEERIITRMKHQPESDTNKYVVISLNDIRSELSAAGEHPGTMYLGLIADARITAAFARGYSVIYDAMNLDKTVRDKYLSLADSYGIKEKKLIISNMTHDEANHKIDAISAFISVDMIPGMLERLERDYPSKADGWTEILEYGNKEKTLLKNIEKSRKTSEHSDHER